jgi:hypothetical protein
MSESLKRLELKLRDGVLLSLLVSKSLKRLLDLKLRDGVLLNLLLSRNVICKARVEAESEAECY